MNIFTRITVYPKILLLLLLYVVAENATAQIANFSINTRTGCVPLGGVNFTDISTGGGGIISRDWNLGNGTTILNGASIVGTNYLTSQTFYVTLIVRFANGTTLSKLDSVIVYPKPVANFIANDTAGCVPHIVNFTSLSTTATGSITNYTWDFGAGGSTFPSPQFTYTVPGQYNISLIVKNSWGCESNAATKPLYIHTYTQPVASFTPSPMYTCKDTLTVCFNNTTTGGGPTNVYEWDFGDNTALSNLKNPCHFYAAPGVYTVKLKAKIGLNCNSTTQTYYYNSIYVGKPTPAFVSFPDTVCINTPTTYTGTFTPNNIGTYIKWIFSDNGQNQFYSPISHTFGTAGDFEVLLIAYNYVGCNDTIRKMVHVKPGPVVDFIPDFVNGACIPHLVNFNNTSIGTDLQFTWNFGDGPNQIVNGQTNEPHTYNAFGTYAVNLYGTDTSLTNPTAGCTGRKTFNY